MTHNDLETALADGMALAFHARGAPDRLAVDSEFGSRTFFELNARVNQLARVFREVGLQADDGVAMLMTNRPEFVEVYFACLRAGLRVTPINWHLTGDNAAYIVGNCEAKAFIADVRCRMAATDALSEHQDQLSLSLAVGGDIDGFKDYEASLAPMDSSDLTDPILGTQMLYTSGTTGRPKGVYRPRVVPSPGQPNRADTVTRAGLAAAWNPETDRALCTGPAYHAAPLAFNVVAPLNQGVGTVLMDKWDAHRTLELIQSHGITHTHMVATMFHRLLALGESTLKQYNVASLRYLLHGAAPCPVHVKQSMIHWMGPVLFEYYAATEGGGGFFIDSKEWLTKPGTVGRSPEGADNRILNDEGESLPAGQVGTIYFKAPAARFHYFKDEEKTANSYRGEFFTLGDMGYFDEDGYLFLTGRSAETIISGGVNIYPQETDDVLLKHEAVLDACTVGVPNDEWGEEVKSVVQLNPGFSASADLAEELITFCREQLSAFKCPRTLEFADDLPRLPSGKIQRGLVRAPFWAGRDRQI